MDENDKSLQNYGKKLRHDSAALLQQCQALGEPQTFAITSPTNPQLAAALSQHEHTAQLEHLTIGSPPMYGQNNLPNTDMLESCTGLSARQHQHFQSFLGAQQEDPFCQDPGALGSIPAYRNHNLTVSAVRNTQWTPQQRLVDYGIPSSRGNPPISSYNPTVPSVQNAQQISHQKRLINHETPTSYKNRLGADYDSTAFALNNLRQALGVPTVSAVSNPRQISSCQGSISRSTQTLHSNLPPSHSVDNALQTLWQDAATYQEEPTPISYLDACNLSGDYAPSNSDPTASVVLQTPQVTHQQVSIRCPPTRDLYKNLPASGHNPAIATARTAQQSAYQQMPLDLDLAGQELRVPMLFTAEFTEDRNIIPSFGYDSKISPAQATPQLGKQLQHESEVCTPRSASGREVPCLVSSPPSYLKSYGLDPFAHLPVFSPSSSCQPPVYHSSTPPSAPTLSQSAELDHFTQIPVYHRPHSTGREWSEYENACFMKEIAVIRQDKPQWAETDSTLFMGDLSKLLSQKYGIDRSEISCRNHWHRELRASNIIGESGSDNVETQRQTPGTSKEKSDSNLPSISHPGLHLQSPEMNMQGFELPPPSSSHLGFHPQTLERIPEKYEPQPDARKPRAILEEIEHQWKLKTLPKCPVATDQTPRISLRNRATRIQNDQDQIFEGLPIRNWRRVETHVGPQSEEQPLAGTSYWPELPMPRDSHLLSEMSRQLLRIARAPRVSKRSEPAEDEEKENAEDMESKDNSRGFTVKKWVQMPKGYEASDRDYLAKRRKGLPPLHAGYGVSVPLDQSKTYRTLKVRRADINGVEHVYEVMAEVGQVVEGEILEADKAVAAPVDPPAAPGTIIEGVGVVNSDGVVIAQPTPKRKPLPPRRKKKGGPGRSKKKLLPELGPDGVPIVSSDAANAALTSDAIGSTAVDTENGDTPMPDAPEGEEDEEGSGEEGDEMDEDDGHEDGEISATSTPAQAQLLDPEPPKTEPSEDETLAETILSAPQLVSAHVAISTEAALETASDTVPDTSSFSEVLLPTVEPEMPMSELPILEVPTVELQSPAADPVIVPPPADVQVQSAEPIIPSIITEAPVLPAAPAPLPIMEPDPHPAPAEPFIAPVMTTPPALIPEPLTPEPEEAPAPSPPPAPIVAAAEPVAAVEPVADAPLTAVPTETQIPPPPATNEDDEVVFEDGEVDLLGSLEAQLDKQGAESKGLDKLDDSEETPKVD